MKKLRKKGNMVLGLSAVILSCGLTAQAAGQTFDGQETAQTTGQGSVQTLSQQTVRAGIYADDIDLSGKNADEVSTAVEAYVEGLRSEKITFQAVGGGEGTVSAGDLGIVWVNTDLPKQALGYGTVGNVIERYKTLKDLEYETYSFDIELDFDKNKITDVLTEQCSVYDIKALNAGLTKGEDGRMIVTDGVTGQVVDVDASTDMVYRYLTEEWDKKPCSIGLVIVSEEPKGSEEELSQLTDLLGSFTTSYSTSGSSRCANVENGCRLINGTVLYPGEEFSVTLAPKGFGSENMSAMRMFTPAASREQIEDWIVSCVDNAGSNPCPPVILGVGLGGTIEQCALEAKRALLAPMDQPNPDPFYDEMEQRILEKINRLGIGPQGMGGDVTALGVHIRPYPTHIAGLPCVVNMSCHVTRHASGRL